ncbi:fatty acid synthase-like isoform X2 [Haliotis rubra]|uniref:fatty acid synthase-like isoform X2 n=1 Tax=Haliotis rubra TaxID=36100 RepID=UPI001EE605C2|nr:fatty acid synthase-like isoform X2 [Haliotis rubra]
MIKAYISGVSCRFPKSNNVQEFWQNLIDGVDMLGPSRWPPGLYGLPPRAGSIPDLGTFDAEFFGYSETEARHSNLLLRLLFEVTYESVVDSGLTLSSLRSDRTGLYVACTFSDADAITTSAVTDSVHANLRSTLLQQLNAWYRFQGPVASVDTACSSSVSALQMAVTDLITGRCNYAVVTGVNLILSPNCSQSFNRLGMLSPTGDSHVFDISANGYVRSDGVAVLILARNPERCERIYATIADIAVNCDGYKVEGIVYPSRSSQGNLLRSLYGEKLIPTSSLAYVEAHGTGTQAGDCLELNAILDGLCEGRDEPLLVGSVKSNMGHCEAASGLSAVVKCIMSIYHGMIPPCLHYKTPNEGIEGIPLGKIKIVDTCHKLKGRISIMGINSFGFGGVNGHLILMSYKNPPDECKKAGTYLVPLTVRSEEGIARIRTFLEKHSENVALLKLMSRSMLSCDPRQQIRGYAIVDLPEIVCRTSATVTYTVKVTTGSKFGAGTDANVFIDLQGDLQKSGKIDLKESKTPEKQFERRNTDEFLITTKDVGHLQRIVIGHDDKGAAASWFLGHVTVHSSSLDFTWTFPCERWLAEDEDDGRIMRELLPKQKCPLSQEPCVSVYWSPRQQHRPPLWLLVQDIAWRSNMPHADLLQLGVFKQSLQESDEILRSLETDVSVTESLEKEAAFKPATKVGLVCLTAVNIGLMEVLKASGIRPDGFIGSGLSEITVAYLDACLTHKQCLQVALAIGETLESLLTEGKGESIYSISLHSDFVHKLGPKTNILTYINNTVMLAALPEQDKDYILKQVEQAGGVYSELTEDVMIYMRFPEQICSNLEKKLKSIIPSPRKRTPIFRSCSHADSTSHSKARQTVGASYFMSLLQRAVNQHQRVSSLPKEATLLSLCMTSLCTQTEVSCSRSGQTEVHCHPRTLSVLQTLGELHELGHTIKAGHLYPPSAPLDCSNPPLSPLVTWNHSISWPLPDWCQFSDTVKNQQKDVYRLPETDLERSVYDPLALLIVHAWAAVCGSKDSLQSTVLHSLVTTPELMKQECLHGALIHVHPATMGFAIQAEGGVVMKGQFKHLGNNLDLPLVPGYDVDQNENVAKPQEDCEHEVETEEVVWEDSWLEFINAVLEFVNPHTPDLPIKVMLDPEQHMKITHDCASVLVMMEENTGICKAGGVVLQFQPSVKRSLDQSILLHNLNLGDASSTSVVDSVLLYSLPSNNSSDDKLLLYTGHTDNEPSEQIGLVSITDGGVKHKSYSVPENWKAEDLEAVVPFILAFHTLRDVASVSPEQSAVLLNPLDTVALYMIAMLTVQGSDVFTCTWDHEMSLMLRNAFPKVKILHPRSLGIQLKQLTKGKGVDVCFKSDGSDMNSAMDLVADHGRCVLTGRPSEKDSLGMSAFLRNITVMSVSPATIFSQLQDTPDKDILAALETITSSSVRDRADDGYPEPRGLRYCVEEQMKFSQPISLQKLFTLLDGPGCKMKDVLDGIPENDVASVERLQLTLSMKPQEFSITQNTSYLNDSKDQLNIARTSSYMEASKLLTPSSAICSGLLAPPNTIRNSIISVDMSQYTSASTPIIRITVDSPSSACYRDPLASLDLKFSGVKLEGSYMEDKVFASPGHDRSRNVLSRMPTTPQTMDFLFVGVPRTPMTPHSPCVKKLLTPSRITPPLLKLNDVVSKDKPIFIVHPITGTLLLLTALGKALNVPCYGVQRTPSTTSSSVTDMAGFYRNAIEIHDSAGPYRLAGYSYGGMIAFEIARQLQKSNKKVECLIILDGGPGFVHSHIAIGREELDRADSASNDSTEIVALVSFVEMYGPIKARQFLIGALGNLPSGYPRVRMAVDFIMGNVVISESPKKTKWMSLKNRILNKDKSERKMGLHSAATEVIRLSREKKAEEYINSTFIADKYRPQEKFIGNIHLLRVKSDPTISVPMSSDYGLGQLCTGEVKVKFVEGDHQSFLKSDKVEVVAQFIENVLSREAQ